MPEPTSRGRGLSASWAARLSYAVRLGRVFGNALAAGRDPPFVTPPPESLRLRHRVWLVPQHPDSPLEFFDNWPAADASRRSETHGPGWILGWASWAEARASAEAFQLLPRAAPAA